VDEITRTDINSLVRKAYLKDLALYLAYYCKEDNQDAAEVVEYALQAVAARATNPIW